ncbi:MAG: hypothetical protein M1832_003571 [Thelocarpon impressellum]|nr:MAG: hypothetical protein M1832_003571 [Thelocarpon impressellum]
MSEASMRGEEHDHGLGKTVAADDSEFAGYDGRQLEDSRGGNELSEQAEEANRLKDLTENVRDQDDLERHVALQADKLLREQADKQDQRRIDKVNAEREKVLAQERKLRQRLAQPIGPSTGMRLQAELDSLRGKVEALDNDVHQIERRMDERHEKDDKEDGAETLLESQGNRRQANESQRDFLIRTGKITPFAKLPEELERSGSNLQDVMLDAEEGDQLDQRQEELLSSLQDAGPQSHQNLRMPGFAEDSGNTDRSAVSELGRTAKRRRLSKDAPAESREILAREHTRSRAIADAGGGGPVKDEVDSGSSFGPGPNEDASSTELEDENYIDSDVTDKRRGGTGASRKRTRTRKKSQAEDETNLPQQEDLSGLDDGNEQVYQARLNSWVSRRSQAREKAISKGTAKDGVQYNQGGGAAEDDEWQLPHPTQPDAEIREGFRIPGDIYPSLFDYQKTGVGWLCELYTQGSGGIIGDEMGLGKTIQVISFLAGLHYSTKLTKPIIVVTPATVMKQWVNEFHRWWPPLRVSILHTSGSGMLNVRGEDRFERDIENYQRGDSRQKMTKAQQSAAKIVRTVLREGHVLVTTYAGLQTYAELLIPVEWEYAVLDEGHKIRNPNTAITIYCKELRTANRVILSGTPMQNNLTELWSLFDFVYPMRLGTLLNFRNQFEIPIKIGGYANATNLEVETASECAARLKDAISPYLLQRLKVDVAADLPKKSEQVLFCKLTKPQRKAYEEYLVSDDVKKIMNGQLRSFAGIEMLRKICNHPDLMDRHVLKKKTDYKYGDPAKSGKMQVVKALLEVWKQGGHKTLLFAQQKIVLDILEKFVRTLVVIKYRRMDGDTPIERRQVLVDEFNTSPDLHVFLLTTKVGGLGVNLTGADRVIIFDPDWNPSTDTQARERAWRLGQKREVTIYRLMTAGTIEEKIYHRQLFKQFLANKILRDPKQRQAFPMKDLHDLFSFGGEGDGATETGELFKGAETKLPNGGSSSRDGDARIGSGGDAPRQSTGDDQPGLRAMPGVAGVEDFVDPDEEKQTTGHEARFMEGILAGSGVHSALEHDQIINGRKKVQADPETVRREARRFADEAAKELDKAGQAARLVPVGTPTWTGQYGVTGRPDPAMARRGVGRAGPASAGILAGLQSRAGAGSGNMAAGARRVEDRGPSPGDFLKLIREFFIRHGGQVRSKMLVDHFDRMCKTREQSALFKELLRKIATLERGGRMRGNWVLKDEYK